MSYVSYLTFASLNIFSVSSYVCFIYNSLDVVAGGTVTATSIFSPNPRILESSNSFFLLFFKYLTKSSIDIFWENLIVIRKMETRLTNLNVFLRCCLVNPPNKAPPAMLFD